MKALATLMIVASLYAHGAHADPARWQREGWRTDFARSAIDWSEIMSGGPPRDGIPSIDEPQFVPVAKEKTLSATEPVITLLLGTDARAYPLRILIWHEIINDTVDGRPVTVTYCPLCNSSIVFDRVIDGKAVTFGTTGKLRNSDLVMYDRATQSWWQQFTGEAIVGALTGRKLKMIPSRIQSFAEFARDFPAGRVLVTNNANFRPYGRNPYVGYDSSAVQFLYRGDMPKHIPAMARVVVVRGDNGPLIVTLERVRQAPYEIDGFHIEWTKGVNSALDKEAIERGRDIGTVRVTRDGKDVVHDQTFAFVAHAFHPDTPITDR